MRRFSSEGSLLDLDFLPWRKVALKNQRNDREGESGTYTPHLEEDELDGRSASLPPIIREPKQKCDLTKEHSVSVENLSEQAKLEKNQLRVGIISEGCRAYSDSQLALDAKGSTESVERDEQPPPSPSSSSNPFTFKSHHRHHAKVKLSAAKLHIRSLFGQVKHQLSLERSTVHAEILRKPNYPYLRSV